MKLLNPRYRYYVRMPPEYNLRYLATGGLVIKPVSLVTKHNLDQFNEQWIFVALKVNCALIRKEKKTEITGNCVGFQVLTCFSLLRDISDT